MGCAHAPTSSDAPVLWDGVAAGVARVAEAVERILDGVPLTDDAALLVLENSAGGGNGIGESLEELIDIHEAMAARGVDLDRVAYCLDSAHLWGAGVDLAGDVEVDRLVDQFDRRIGLEKLVMIHYNDSKAAHGSKLDRHQHIGGGEVGTRGLAALISHPRLAHVNYYLETPGMEEGWDRLNVERTIQLSQGNLKLKIMRRKNVRDFSGRKALDGSGLHFNTTIIKCLKRA